MQHYPSEWNKNEFVEWFDTDWTRQTEVCSTTTSQDMTSSVERICQYPTRTETAQCTAFPSTQPVFDTQKHVKWDCTMPSTQAYVKIHSFANNTAALHGVWFATDAAVQSAVQKALRAICAKEFEKTMRQKWQEQI